MNLPFLHVEAALTPGGGSPMYGVLPEHIAVVAGVALLPATAWAVRRLASGNARAARIMAGYGALPLGDRIVAWLLAASAVIHLALVPGHGDGPGLLFLVAAALLGTAAWRLVIGRGWRRLAVLTLLGSILAYWVSATSGEPPDEVGIATKVVELAALAFIWRSGGARARRLDRVRRAFGTARVPLLAVLLAMFTWAGAFVASEGDAPIEATTGSGSVAAAGDDHGGPVPMTGHGHGAVPGPGTVMPAIDHLVPTAAEIAAADELHRRLGAAIARYADPAAAAADGYHVEGMHGLDFHADNPAYGEDGRILDPERPETLVYAVAPDGRPVLLGAMFSMPDRSEPGPAVGGPLTVWHAHERICLGLVPPGLASIRSPLGACPVGSIEIPITPEMIHVWTVPGAPTRFGDLDGAWLEAYLRG
jgi:hypothetical protein